MHHVQSTNSLNQPWHRWQVAKLAFRTLLSIILEPALRGRLSLELACFLAFRHSLTHHASDTAHQRLLCGHHWARHWRWSGH